MEAQSAFETRPSPLVVTVFRRKRRAAGRDSLNTTRRPRSTISRIGMPCRAAYSLASRNSASGNSTVVFTQTIYHIYGYPNAGRWAAAVQPSSKAADGGCFVFMHVED